MILGFRTKISIIKNASEMYMVKLGNFCINKVLYSFNMNFAAYLLCFTWSSYPSRVTW